MTSSYTTSLTGSALRRRRAVLAAVGQDPCALDIIVWAAVPLVPTVLDRLFEVAACHIFEGPEGKSGRSACVSPEEPPLRWALMGPSEADLRRALSGCQASLRWGGPASMLPDHPMGPNPYLVAVMPGESSVLNMLTSRAAVLLNASEEPVPAVLRTICVEHFIDLIDASGATGPQEPMEEILAGGPRRRGAVIHLGGPDDDAIVPPETRATRMVALVDALVVPAREMARSRL